jgi:hypothetical protein
MVDNTPPDAGDISTDEKKVEVVGDISHDEKNAAQFEPVLGEGEGPPEGRRKSVALNIIENPLTVSLPCN